MPEEVEIEVEIARNEFFIMRDGKRVAYSKCSFYGNDAPSPHEPNSVYINEIHVDKAYRRRGLATALIGKIFEEARRRELNCVALETQIQNVKMRNLAVRMGFNIKEDLTNEYVGYYRRRLD